jgi:hypothetical protein
MWIFLIIIYFIWIPICFIGHWAWMCAYNHKVNWKNITIGEFLIGILYSIVPLVNFIVTLIASDYLYRHNVCFTFLDKPLFHERN